MLERVIKSAEFLMAKGIKDPEAGIVLGTGLGGLTADIDIEVEIPYSEIPDFPVSTVQGHAGTLIYGNFGGKKVVAMKGRFHYYEGYGSEQVTFPIRVMKELGIRALFLSNAAGGVNPTFRIGDIMLIQDHLCMVANPLIGPNDDRIGPRFPDMSEPYDLKLITRAEQIAADLNIPVRKGVYLSTTGPTFETPAEYKFFRIIGADAVGMSTVPEVITARHMSLPVFAVSVITDLGVEGRIEYTTHESVQKAAEHSEEKMTAIMRELIASF